MHYAFDMWITKNYPDAPFERYVAIIHCKTEQGAMKILEALNVRLTECKLEFHPQKTNIVYARIKTELEIIRIRNLILSDIHSKECS